MNSKRPPEQPPVSIAGHRLHGPTVVTAHLAARRRLVEAWDAWELPSAAGVSAEAVDWALEAQEGGDRE